MSFATIHLSSATHTHTYTQHSDTLDCRLPVFLLWQRCVAVCCSVLQYTHTRKTVTHLTADSLSSYCRVWLRKSWAEGLEVTAKTLLHTRRHSDKDTASWLRKWWGQRRTAYIHLKDNSLHIPKGQEPTYTCLYAETSRYRHYILTSICEFSRAFIFTVCNTKNLLLYFPETVCLKKILMYFSETVCLSYFYCFLCLFVHPYPFAHT